MRRVFLAALAAALAPTVGSAAITIDDFNDVTAPVFVTADTSYSVALTGPPPPPAPSRDVVIDVTPDTGGATLAINRAMDQNGYTLLAGTSADISFDYDFTGNLGGFIDLTQMGANASLILDLVQAGSARSVVLTLSDLLGNSGMVSIPLPTAVSMPLTRTTNFSEFTGVDATQATGLTISTTLAGFSDSITFGSVSAATVPEPMSLTLAGLLGVGLCGGAVRRRKRAAA